MNVKTSGFLKSALDEKDRNLEDPESVLPFAVASEGASCCHTDSLLVLVVLLMNRHHSCTELEIIYKFLVKKKYTRNVALRQTK